MLKREWFQNALRGLGPSALIFGTAQQLRRVLHGIKPTDGTNFNSAKPTLKITIVALMAFLESNILKADKCTSSVNATMSFCLKMSR